MTSVRLVVGHLGVEEVGGVACVGAACVGAIWAIRRRDRGPRSRAGSDRRPRDRRRDLLLAAGLLALVTAVSGPVDRAADRLFWVHMVQHVVLLTVAAPLIAAGAPWRLLPGWFTSRWATRPGARGSGEPVAQNAVTAWVVFNLTFLAFHLPVLYDAALEQVGVHLIEHALFLATAVWFWAVVFDARSFGTGPAELWRAGYVLSAAVVGWALAIVLTFAPEPLYREYARLSVRPGGISALADQQLAAGVMLVPGSITFLLVAGMAMSRWLATTGTDDGQQSTATHEEISA